MNESKCPVPKEQQPTNEFIELSKSKIFSIISVLVLSGILLFQYNDF